MPENSRCYDAAFASAYTYQGNDLGAVWSAEKTVFRLWAPTAACIRVKLYCSGDPEAQDCRGELVMTPDICGTWVAAASGNLHGVYYTYLVTVDGTQREVCDPYARATGVNGIRAMVVNPAAVNPPDWDLDAPPHPQADPTDAVIYEVHIRDVSSHPSSGIAHTGKYSGLAQTGTVTSQGYPTGLDHIATLGVTHVQLLPIYDFGSVDESRPDVPQYNWGYDPVNFNVPEGSYATDARDGSVRIRELKQLIQALHRKGLGVIMDVVYNHVYDADSFCFNRIVPGYFSRADQDGTLSNGSGCGNDTASERTMVQKFIVDSVCYWAEEYHLDGFRFDLVGLLDTDTVNAVVAAVRQRHPHVLFYGEGWTLDTQLTVPCSLAIQENACLTPGFGYFNDTIRDLLRGTVFDDRASGFVSGIPVDRAELDRSFMGQTSWCPSPAQSVNYACCHDNTTLFDRLTMSNPQANFGELAAMNRLAAAFILTARGIAFLHAGEELLRSKPLPEGGYSHNSYCSPDSVNAICWEHLHREEYRQTAAYYAGLIAFRKAHPSLRSELCPIIPASSCRSATAAYHILCGEAEADTQAIYVIFNGEKTSRSFVLPQGRWQLCIDAVQAGTTPLAVLEGEICVPPVSAAVLLQPRSTG